MKGLGRKKKKDPITINVVGCLSDIKLGKVVNPKYVDPGSPIVIVNLKSVSITNTLIDFGEAINVMIKYIMLNLNLQTFLRNTTTILQLKNSSTVCLEGMIEDVTIHVHSWEYPMDFIVLRTKNNFSGYPLILGRPSLATIDAHLSCRQRSMIVPNGLLKKNLNIFPPAKLSTNP